MPRKIIEVVRQKKAEFQNNKVLATQNMMMAMAALQDGIKSEAWQLYMTQFVDQNPPGKPVDPDQLLRLLGKDGTQGDLFLDRQRAYLVANSICGPSTVDTFDVGVDTIDYTMGSGSVSRPVAPECEANVNATATQRRKVVTKTSSKKGEHGWG